MANCVACAAARELQYLTAHEAVNKNDLPALKCFIDHQGVDVNARDHYGETLLHEAAMGHSLEMVCFLLERGANVLASSKTKVIPLHKAVRNWVYGANKQLEVITQLLAHQETGLQQVSAKTARGDNALHMLGTDKTLEIARVLLWYGADIHALGWERKTAAELARLSGLQELADYLEQAALAMSEKKGLQEALSVASDEVRPVRSVVLKRTKSL